jgi:aminoglycoside 2'-N-acetyltransferase I
VILGLLNIQVKKGQDFSESEYAEMLALCSQAFRRDYSPVFKLFQDTTHIFGRYDGQLVTHALWITRWLQIGTSPPLRTAYIEALATELNHRKKGFASEIMKRVTREIQDFDIGALSTGSPDFYTRLGWQLWCGPLFIRTEKGLMPTPNEHGVMVLLLPRTPPLDIDVPLSAEWRKGELW